MQLQPRKEDLLEPLGEAGPRQDLLQDPMTSRLGQQDLLQDLETCRRICQSHSLDLMEKTGTLHGYGVR